MIQRERGLSLIELLISLAISAFLMLGIYKLFQLSMMNVQTTSQYNQLQESARIAVTILENDLSQIGFMGDITGTDLIVNTNTSLTDIAIKPSKNCIGGGENNETFPIVSSAPFRLLWGYEHGVSAESISCLKKVDKKTDVFQLKRLIGPNTLTPTNDKRYYVASTNSNALFFKGTRNYPSVDDSRYWEYQHHVYFIATETGKIPVLRRKTLTGSGMGNDEQLVEGVENIRLLYGFDLDGDSTADKFVPVTSITESMWNNSSAPLIALRVFLLIRSVEQDKHYLNNIVYMLGDKQIGPLNDHYRRKVIATTVILENMRDIRL